jgi:pseudouridine-5'-phosphate glycosidase
MPYPQNVHTAQKVEQTVLDNGATPATIAILNGVIHVGLTPLQLELLGKLGTKVRKVSRRDIALCVGEKLNGSTTVSATMIIAHMAGIKVFVTGGIGGVHREYNETMDVSADLRELGRTPIAVICAGVKSILDIPRTMEYLETEGVSVVGYGTDEFPAFFTRRSGVKVPIRLDTPDSCAKLIKSNLDLKLESGMLFAVPIPAEHEAKIGKITEAIEQSLEESREKHVQGKDITPFLLERINQLTEGESLKASTRQFSFNFLDISLILNNAKHGAMIASSLSKVCK